MSRNARALYDPITGKVLERDGGYVTDQCPEKCGTCGGGAPKCPWRWRADICVDPACPAPSSIYVCSDTPSTHPSGIVQPGCVIADYGHCYTVSDECKYVEGTPGPGECALPAGAVLQSFASYDCLPSCNTGGCEPASGWFILVLCDCTPGIDCGDVPPPRQISNAFVSCEDYFEAINVNGWKCPAVNVPNDLGGAAVCARVGVELGLFGVLPPGATVYGLGYADCCDCCDGNLPGRRCQHFESVRRRIKDCQLVFELSETCCCHECDCSVFVDYTQTNYSPASSCNGPPGPTPGTQTCIETRYLGSWSKSGAGPISGTVTRTTTQYFAPNPPNVIVDVLPVPASLCLLDIGSAFGNLHPPHGSACDQEGDYLSTCSVYSITMDTYADVGPDRHIGRRDVGVASRRTHLGECGACAGGESASGRRPPVRAADPEGTAAILAALAGLGVVP